MKKEPLVSVICNTYNQANYIEQAIKSFLMQSTAFSYEIIVHDDASTDGTIDILKKFEKAFPDIIKVIYESENKYSQGISFMLDMINYSSGKYIAICEGDDFWIDENKLQYQFNALEKYAECDMCVCWGCTVTEDGTREISQIRPRLGDGIISIRDVILGGGMYVVTSSLFARREIYYDMLGMGFLDYAQQIRGALRGGIYYIDRKMSVYRRYAKGSWTNNILLNYEKIKKQWEKEIKMLETFDENTNFQFHDVILQKMLSYVPFEEQLEERKIELFKCLEGCTKPYYIWGYGRRGRSLERFCVDNKIDIVGVCDATEENIGSETVLGNIICTTDYVLENANTIFVSNEYAYNDLKKKAFGKKMINFQQFMPNG